MLQDLDLEAEVHPLQDLQGLALVVQSREVVVLGQSTVEAMVQNTVVVLDQGLVVHTLVLQDLGNFNLHNISVIT